MRPPSFWRSERSYCWRHRRTLLSLPNIRDCAVDVGVVADDQGFVVDWDRHLFQAAHELFDGWTSFSEGFWTTVNSNKLVCVEADDATAKEAAVDGFVLQDVFESFWDVVAVAAAGVV